MFYFGAWGRFDKSMPPRGVGENAVAGRPDAVFDTDYNGWYYTNAKTITDKWAQTMQCGDAANYDIAISGETWTCDQYPGCATGHSVVGCIFEGGHDDLSRNAFDVIFEWIKARSNEPSSDVNSGGNDDACLQDAWAEWDGVWRCDESQEYCVGEWADDMAACCPESCDYEPSSQSARSLCGLAAVPPRPRRGSSVGSSRPPRRGSSVGSSHATGHDPDSRRRRGRDLDRPETAC